MENIDNKFDKYEKIVERVGKLALKIVTGIVALVIGCTFAWNQLHESLDERHVHSEDYEFQEYLMDVETSAGYEGVVDSIYEDSLYTEFYHLDSVGLDTFNLTPPINEYLDTLIIAIDTTSVDTVAVDTVAVDTVAVDTIN